MTKKKPAPAPPTNAERHAKFLAMAKEVNASEKPGDFDRAFQAITKAKSK